MDREKKLANQRIVAEKRRNPLIGIDESSSVLGPLMLLLANTFSRSSRR
jgi:hypothetical protein